MTVPGRVTVEDVENGLLDALRDDPDLASKVRSFSVLPDLGQEEIAKLVHRFPSLAVISLEGAWEENATSVQQESGTFAVLCFNRNLRAPSAALRGGTPAESGVYDLVDGVRSVLSRDGALHLEGLMKCRPLKRRLVRADGAMAVCSVEVEVTWRRFL